MPDTIQAKVLLKVGDNITTDHIMPAGAKILPLRSNIPAISEYVFSRIDSEFPKKAKEAGHCIVVGGDNYGQGSSREHAALAPKYLGLQAVIVKSFARIHLANLINFGILPLTFSNPSDYDLINQGDELEIKDVRKIISENGVLKARIVRSNSYIELNYTLTPRQKEIVLSGGALNYVKLNRK